MSPSRTVTVLAFGVVGTTVAGHACVIADPPSDLPTLPETRPTIMRPSVVPSAAAVLGRWPEKFTVPVELSDPRSTIWYSVFIDYNPATGEGLDAPPSTSEFEPGSASTKGSVRLLDINVTRPPLDRCHVVEIVVALRLKAITDSKNAHTPDEPGGDSVSWFYSPSGDLSGCPILDGGITRSLTDAEAEGGPQ
jgi:hypothetical protein